MGEFSEKRVNLTPKPSGIEGATEDMTMEDCPWLAPIIGIMGVWLAGAQLAPAAGMTVWLAHGAIPPAETAAGGSPVAMGIVHMPPAFDDMAGVLVELTIGVPVFIMLFGLWLNWLLFKKWV